MASNPKSKSQSELLSGKPDATGNQFVVRRDNDRTKNFSVGLRDIDTAVKYYFTEIIKPVIEENDSIINVPVMYASPEKWKSIEVDGFMRDSQDKLLCPLITFQRTGMMKNRMLSSKIDAQQPQIQIVKTRQWSPSNAYTQIAALNNQRPPEETYYVVIPDYVDVTYDVMMWTDKVGQMNTLEEALFYAEGSYWGDKDKFQFSVTYEDITSTIEIEQGKDRSVRSSFSMKLQGYMIPLSIQQQLAAINTKYISVSPSAGFDLEKR